MRNFEKDLEKILFLQKLKIIRKTRSKIGQVIVSNTLKKC